MKTRPMDVERSMAFDRKSIDPEGRYPYRRYTKVERNALRILEIVKNSEVSRTRDAIQIDSTDAWPFAFLVTAEAVEVRFITSSSDPAEMSALWRRRKWDGLSEGKLYRFMKDATAEARKRGRPCVKCGENLPPRCFEPRKRICKKCDGKG